jgi:hypothetical protein
LLFFFVVAAGPIDIYSRCSFYVQYINVSVFAFAEQN